MPGLGLGVGTRHFRRRAGNGQSASVYALVTPATSELTVGQSLQDTVNWAILTDVSNYTTTAAGEAIANVTVGYIGSTATATQTFSDGDLNVFSVTATDTGGTSRTFATAPRSVTYTAPTATGLLLDQSFNEGTGVQFYDASVGFTGGGLTYAVSAPAGVTIDAVSGILTVDTAIAQVQSNTPVTLTASNSGGTLQDSIAFTIAAVELTITGLSGGVALVENAATISAEMSDNSAISAYSWGSTPGGAQFGTGTSPTSITTADGGFLYLTVTSGGKDFGSSAQVSYTAPTATGLLSDQSFNEGTGVQFYDASVGFSGGGLTYAVSGPAGVSIDSTTGVVSFDTNSLVAQPDGVIDVSVTNSGGSAQSSFLLDVIGNSTFSLENVGEEPVISVTSGAVSVTVGAGVYAGTYSTRATDGAQLTVAMVEAAPTPLVLPAVTGNTEIGSVLTIMPGLWLYEGPDPGDQIFRQQLDGIDVPAGNGLTYSVLPGDEGKEFTVEETFGGVTIESPGTSISNGAGPSIATDTAAIQWLNPDNVVTGSGGTVLDQWPNSAVSGSALYDMSVVPTGSTAPSWDAVKRCASNSGTQALVSSNVGTSPFTEANLAANTYCFFAVADINALGFLWALGRDTGSNFLFAFGAGDASTPIRAAVGLKRGSSAFGNLAFGVQGLTNSIAPAKHLHELRFNDTTASFYVDGSLEWTSAVNAAGNTHQGLNDFYATLFGWGNQTATNGSRRARGDLYEFLLTTDLANADAYRAELAARHGITI